MKHPHSEIIKQWLEDTTQEIEQKFNSDTKFYESNIIFILNDIKGVVVFRIKPKQDEYENLRQSVRDGVSQALNEKIKVDITMNKIEKRSDLFREWARIVDMCEGTKVKDYECVTFNDSAFTSTPDFTGNINDYKFALAIVEDRPVFFGYELYYKNTKFIVKEILLNGIIKGEILTDDKDINGEIKIHPYDCSWNPPKPKTFNLNGVELPYITSLQFNTGQINKHTHKTQVLLEWYNLNDEQIELINNTFGNL